MMSIPKKYNLVQQLKQKAWEYYENKLHKTEKQPKRYST